MNDYANVTKDVKMVSKSWKCGEIRITYQLYHTLGFKSAAKHENPEFFFSQGQLKVDGNEK